MMKIMSYIIFLIIITNIGIAEGEFNNLFEFGTYGSGDGQFVYPQGIAVDSSGKIYVADYGNSRVQIFDSTGGFVSKFGTEGTDDGQFIIPGNLALDSLRKVYVTDLVNHRIEIFDSNGVFLGKIGSPGSSDGQFTDRGVGGIVVDGSSKIYIGDPGNKRVQIFDSTGGFVSKFGTEGSDDGQFNLPDGIALDSSGNIYVGDQYNHRIQIFDSNGVFLSKFGTYGSDDGQFKYPVGIAIDGLDQIYVADEANHRVQIFDSTGRLISKFGTLGSSNGQFYNPTHVAIDNSGRIYVSDMYNHRVQVFRVAEANGPYIVDEGYAITFDATGSQDPDGDPLQYRWDFDNDGSWDTAWSSSPTASKTWNDGFSGTVKVEVSDGKLTASDTARVTVNNVAPSATLNAPASVNEGRAISLSLTNPSDPSSADTAAGLLFAFDCGAGYGVYGSVSTASCPTTDNDIRGVKAKIKDKDGGENEYTASVKINNVAPVISSVTGPSDPLALGSSASVTASFTDAGSLDTHTCTISWDDGTSSPGTVTESGGSDSCTGSRTYASAGVYTVGLTVSDDDAASATSSFEYVVVYDTSTGFVTGGGRIDSPAGAYAADPTMTGRANFGFVSKYQKGANKPTGETEFQFKAGNLNFHSTLYEWLVVAGAKAQYKGSGTINGAGDYSFLLTATDGQVSGGGGVDKFRIKIFGAGGVVYDNVHGVSDDIDAANPQAIGGGSIVIHK